MYFEYSYRVDTRDTDPFSQCRPSALLGFLQEAAVDAAEKLHVGREELMTTQNCFWMLARMWYRLDRPLHWNDTILVRTWHRGGKTATMYRDFDLYVEGERIGEAVSMWVLADLDTRKLVRMSQLPQMEGTDGGELIKPIHLTKLRPTVDLTPARERLLRYSDADINGHVNNTRYADLACDAIDLHVIGEGKYVSELQIGYVKETKPGQSLTLLTGSEGDTYFVRGLRGEEDHFDAMVKLKNIP